MLFDFYQLAKQTTGTYNTVGPTFIIFFMISFEKGLIPQLYIAETTAADKGFVAWIIPQNVTSFPPNTLALSEALTNTTYQGTFVFSACTPTIANEQEAQAFVNNIYTVLNASPASRAFIWLQEVNNITKDTAPLMGINSQGTQVSTALQAWLTSNLYLAVPTGMLLSLKDTILTFNGQNSYKIQITGTNPPDTKNTYTGSLDFVGSLRGCIQFTTYIQRDSLYNDLNWGFQYIIPYSDDTGRQALSEWLPLASPTQPNATDYLGFNAVIDPSDVHNQAFNPCADINCSFSAAYSSRRTYFDFLGTNYDRLATSLTSYYTTAFGATINLVPATTPATTTPARLIVSLGERTSSTTENFHFTPEGDFTLQIPSTEEVTNHYIMAGLQGTEFFKVTPQTDTQAGDTLRFFANKPAYVPNFPFATASPVGPPEDPNASLLDTTYTTAWATLVNTSGKSIYYVAQPQGSALFGNDSLIEPDYPNLFGPTTPGFAFEANDTAFFPMIPYAGLTVGDGKTSFSKAQAEQIESQVLSQTRKSIINTALPSKQTTLAAIGKADDNSAQWSTTPSGLLAQVTETSQGTIWNEIQLGWNMDDKRYTMGFTNPQDELVQALQTSDLFLVVANNDYLGTFNNTKLDEPSFDNTMSIGSWQMQANVGTKNQYNDYHNIMIVKSRQGKLYDPDDITNSLIANSKKWTEKAKFAAPTTKDAQGKLQPPDPSQLVILSQWMQDYFKAAYDQKDNPYFKKFCDIATSDTWTGILFLRVDITSLPTNLSGIMAGITNEEAFNAHHLAIEISPVIKGDNGPQTDQPSSIFGLIYYVDPDVADTTSIQPIAPTTSDIYNFRTLSLKVLFENTAVQSFESYAQLTLNQLFDTPVSKTGDTNNVYKNLLLQGSLQINNDTAVYSLSSKDDNTFYLDSNILNKIEITNALLTTRSAADADPTECWFGLQGFMDYKIIENTTTDSDDQQTTTPFDLFSFGNAAGEDKSRQGLSFNNLGIQMTFPNATPQNTTLTFDATEITFDTSKSTPRADSLYTNFALDLEKLIIGTTDKAPKDLGYLAIIPDVRLAGVSGTTWYGLQYKLNMGTPGELAGKVNLNSSLLLAWATDSKETDTSYKASANIALPGTGGGAKLISLQNIMKLSIGQIRLLYVDNADKTAKSFLLMFTEIALKFFGLLKIPPSGSTLFYLFGNPDAGGKASGLGWYAMYKKDQPTQVSASKKNLPLPNTTRSLSKPIKNRGISSYQKPLKRKNK